MFCSPVGCKGDVTTGHTLPGDQTANGGLASLFFLFGKVSLQGIPKKRDACGHGSGVPLLNLGFHGWVSGWAKSVRTTFKPWEATVCWYLQGNHHSRVSQVVQDFVHPQ